MPVLEVAVHGPFTFLDKRPDSDSITLMAPMCADHVATVSSNGENSEAILSGNVCATDRRCRKKYIYVPKFLADSGTGDPWRQNNPCIYLDPAPPTNPLDWHLWIQLPRPAVCGSVNPVEVSWNHDGTTEDTSRPVGVRLIYKNWNGGDVTLDKGDGTTTTFKFPEVNDTQFGQLLVEFSGPTRDDVGHVDAMRCFLNLAHALGKDWTVTYNETRLSGSHGNDCHAPVIWAD